MFSSVSRRICAYPTSALLRNSTIRSRAPLACFHAPSTLRVATAARGLHWSAPKRDSHALPPPTPGSTPSGPIQIEQKLQITFTCTVEDCGDRSSHEFTRRSYEKGIVIVQCPGCKNRHLIADNLGWFKDVTEQGQQRTVEDIMRARGEAVRKGHLDTEGNVVEYAPE